MPNLRKIGRRICLILMIGIGFPSATRACDQRLRSSPALQAAMDKGVRGGIPGIAVAVAKNNRIIFSGVSGFADRERGLRVTRTTMFGIGSITKTFVAVTALQLAAEGRLKLDQTPAKLLGQRASGVPNADTASLLQLMNHTSGIPSWEDSPAWIRDARGSGAKPDRLWKPGDSLRYILKMPATNAPGARFSYSNSNYTLVAMAIEQATHDTLAQELRRRIFRPLGLRHIFLDGFEPVSGVRAAGYHLATPSFRADAGISPYFRGAGGDLIRVGYANLSSEWAAGGLVASADDLVCFGSALQSGRLLAPRVARLMFHFRTIEDDSEGPGTDVGRGIFRTRLTGGAYDVFNSGGVLGFSAYLGYFTDTGISYAIVENLGYMHSGAGSRDRARGWVSREHVPELVQRLGLKP